MCVTWPCEFFLLKNMLLGEFFSVICLYYWMHGERKFVHFYLFVRPFYETRSNCTSSYANSCIKSALCIICILKIWHTLILYVWMNVDSAGCTSASKQNMNVSLWISCGVGVVQSKVLLPVHAIHTYFPTSKWHQMKNFAMCKFYIMSIYRVNLWTHDSYMYRLWDMP